MLGPFSFENGLYVWWAVCFPAVQSRTADAFRSQGEYPFRAEIDPSAETREKNAPGMHRRKEQTGGKYADAVHSETGKLPET